MHEHSFAYCQHNKTSVGYGHGRILLIMADICWPWWFYFSQVEMILVVGKSFDEVIWSSIWGSTLIN